jgi:hypothetical protein
MFIDEMQYVEEDELAALIMALHRCIQRKLPIALVGAGLPQLRADVNWSGTQQHPPDPGTFRVRSAQWSTGVSLERPQAHRRGSTI